MPSLPEKTPLPAPRVLLSIDYEPWYAFAHRYDSVTSSEIRRELDEGYTKSAIDPLLGILKGTNISFYLTGDVAEWYPEVPEKILTAGHELGFHCQFHRTLIDETILKKDLEDSAGWRSRFNIRGYRAPMVGISEGAYPLLKASGFQYSSSIYAPSGTILQKNGIWEIPVSTIRLYGSRILPMTAPRVFSWRLLLSGELPYGSSFTIGLIEDGVLRAMERDMKAGLSPVVVLHPHELVRPRRFIRNVFPDLIRLPQFVPFAFDKTRFLTKVLKSFPVSSMGSYLDEALILRER